MGGNDNRQAEWMRQLCAFLGADPIYSHICLEQRCYRARSGCLSCLSPGVLATFVGNWPCFLPCSPGGFSTHYSHYTYYAGHSRCSRCTSVLSQKFVSSLGGSG
jgi:hypothetical protein